MDVLDLNTLATERIWQSKDPAFEAPAGTVLNESKESNTVMLDSMQLLFTREYARDPPQFFAKTFSVRCRTFVPRRSWLSLPQFFAKTFSVRCCSLPQVQ